MFSPFSRRVTRYTALGIVALLIASCSASSSQPASTSSDSQPQGQGTAGPETSGALTPISIDDLGLSMLVPSDWKPPVVLDDRNRLVLSPTGSTDTSASAGPFLYIISDTTKYMATHLSYVFRPDISDPAQQLDLLMQAVNMSDPTFDATESYIGAKYPAAIQRGYARDNEMTFVLLNAGNGRWIYVGAQALERQFKYYNDNVFSPVTNSLAVK